MGPAPGADAVADAGVVRAADANAADAMDVAERTTVGGEAIGGWGRLSSICRYGSENIPKPPRVGGNALGVAAAPSGALGRLDVGAGSSVEARGAVKGLLAAVTAGTGTWDLGKGPRGSRAAATVGAG